MPELLELTDAQRAELVSRLPGVPEARTLTDALTSPTSTTLNELALDRRRLAVPADAYLELVDPLEAALRYVLWIEPPESVTALHAVAVKRLHAMAEVAHQADLAGIPPATAAQVLGATSANCTTGTTAVYLEAPHRVDYLPGQRVPVLLPSPADAVWIELTPANPANDFGQLTFLLPSDLGAAALPGAHWVLGHPRGSALIPEDLPAGGELALDGTGDQLAAARAAVFSLVELSDPEARPRVTVNASDPGLAGLAGRSDWLRVAPA